MTTVLGLLGLVLFVAGVIALASGVTYAVIRITPTRDKSTEQQATP